MAGDFENQKSRNDQLIAAASVERIDCSLRLAEDSDHAFQIWTCVVPCVEPSALHAVADANNSCRNDNSPEPLELF